MSDALARVIREAIVGKHVGSPNPNRFCYGGIIDANHIAAAVAAHLQSPEAIERMSVVLASAIDATPAEATQHWRDMSEENRDLWRLDTRAAISAAIARGEDV